MGRRREVQLYDGGQTSIAVIIAGIGGGGIWFYIDSTLDDMQGIGYQHARRLPDWQIHTAAACLGTVTFLMILFCLELMARRSKMMAWRSSWPFLPLIGLTGLASLIHIPAYAVIPIGALLCVWAYRQTSRVL